MSVVESPFKKEDWGQVEHQAGISIFEPTADLLASLEASPWSVTLRSQGRVVALMGIHLYWPGRAECWAVFDRRCVDEFLAIHRTARRIIFRDCTVRRVEAVVEYGFAKGHRWMGLLGFVLEAGRMPHYYPDGKDCSLYSRIRKD